MQSQFPQNMYRAMNSLCTELFVACRDGGIDATIDHEQSFMSSKEVTDIYSTEEPQSAFHARVAFCLDIHNEVCS